MEKCRKMCEKGVDKRSRNINRTIKKSGFTATLSKKEKNDLRQRAVSSCMLVDCNPGCKGTIYNNDPKWINGIKKEYQQQIHSKEMTPQNVKQAIFFARKTRKGLIKESGSTLLNQDSFYRMMKPFDHSMVPGLFRSKKKKMLPATYKQKKKSKGALSGCQHIFFSKEI
jgi:hypothetical protein